MVLGFDTALPDSGAYELATRGLRGVSGAPLGDERYSFALVREKTGARLLGAEALDAHRVVLNFDKAVRAPEGANNFSLGAGVIVERVEIRDRQVTLFLREGAGIRPLGRSYRAVVEGLVDADGLAVRGEATACVRFGGSEPIDSLSQSLRCSGRRALVWIFALGSNHFYL